MTTATLAPRLNPHPWDSAIEVFGSPSGDVEKMQDRLYDVERLLSEIGESYAESLAETASSAFFGGARAPGDAMQIACNHLGPQRTPQVVELEVERDELRETLYALSQEAV